jgi:hypothetical protein
MSHRASATARTLKASQSVSMRSFPGLSRHLPGRRGTHVHRVRRLTPDSLETGCPGPPAPGSLPRPRRSPRTRHSDTTRRATPEERGHPRRRGVWRDRPPACDSAMVGWASFPATARSWTGVAPQRRGWSLAAHSVSRGNPRKRHATPASLESVDWHTAGHPATPRLPGRPDRPSGRAGPWTCAGVLRVGGSIRLGGDPDEMCAP